MADRRLDCLTLTPQWNYDSGTGNLFPQWVNPDESTFPVVPFILGRSHWRPSPPSGSVLRPQHLNIYRW